MTDPPIYVNVRDRVRDLRRLVAWLEKAGHERIVLVDCASTYEPCVEYLAASPHTVVRLRTNSGSRALWNEGIGPSEPFVYTDSDTVPCDDCPLDAVARLADLLDRFPAFPKAALGLYLDDFPPSLDQGILRWERSLVCEGRAVAAGVYASLSDTSFALYRAGVPFGYTALRTGAPYLCDHAGWAAEANPDAEDLYYLDHATAGPEGSSWARRRAAA